MLGSILGSPDLKKLPYKPMIFTSKVWIHVGPLARKGAEPISLSRHETWRPGKGNPKP